MEFWIHTFRFLETLSLDWINMNQTQKNTLKKNYTTLKKLADLSGNSIVELIMVYMDYKPATAEPVYLNEKLIGDLPQIQSIANSLGLFFSTSTHKYIINSPRGIFSEIPLKDTRLGKIILSFSKSADKAFKGAFFYHKKMLDSSYGYKFGELMGYPKCCLKFGDYLANNSSDPKNFGFNNPAIESLKKSKHFDWHLNVFTTSLVPHFPCSLTCKESIKYVEKVIDCLVCVDEIEAKIQNDYLTQPASLYWTCADRILLYGNYKQHSLGSGEISYMKVEPMIVSSTFYQNVDKSSLNLWQKIHKFLEKGNKLVVNDNYCKIFKGKQLIFKYKKDNRYTPVLIKPDILPK